MPRSEWHLYPTARMPQDRSQRVHPLKNNVEFGIVKGGTVALFKKKNNNFYDSSHKFAIVRNPYDRVVSSYFYALKKGWYSGSFREFTMEPFEDFFPMFAWHTQPLTVTLDFPGQGVDYLDEVIKIENLTAGVNNLFEKFDLPRIKLPHRNKGEHEHYTKYYDDETRQIVAEKFAKDIECFGYEFEGQRGAS